MIVRNEAHVLERCAASVRDLIDTWVVVDTGSTDGTPEAVRAALGSVPGALHERPWQDFGTNRTELMALSRGAADYLLLLDADMTLRRHGPLPALQADAYALRHEGWLGYHVPRLVRGDREWRFVGATHEYLGAPGPFTTERLEAWSVEHHADGGSRSDKLTRDRRLLEAALAKDPADARATFYLAQTYRDLGEAERAATLYARRATMGGFEEEAFYAAFQRAVLVADADWEHGKGLLVDAWQRRPTRLEPLYELAVRARLRGDNALAAWAGEHGLGAGEPDDLLFVHRHVYDWGLRFERSVACANLGQLEEASALTDELLDQDGLPDDVVAALAHNRRWLDGELARLRSEPAAPAPAVPAPAGRPRRRPTGRAVPLLADLVDVTQTPFPGLPIELPEGRAPTNPSIAAGPDRLAAIVRLVNYALRPDGSYRSLDGGAELRTTNVLAGLDGDLSVRAATLLGDDPDRPVHPTGIAGFEDCRLVHWQGGWWATATSRDLSADARCQMALLAVDDGRLRLAAALPSPLADRHEKNWMPFVRRGELLLVYALDPYQLLRVDPDDHHLEPVDTPPGDRRLAGLRGGSQGVPVDDGFLFAVHEVRLVGTARWYLHRLVTLDGQLRPTGSSRAFRFGDDPVEFCAGAALVGDDVVLSYGIRDGRAALARLALDDLIDLVEPL